MAKYPPIIPGDKFGRLTVVESVPGNRNLRWRCVCECGGEKLVYQPNLRSGGVASCGCKNEDRLRLRRKEKILHDGYVLVKAPDHPRAGVRNKRVREHILVMEKVLGRYLIPGEEVHHINGDKTDNRPENLELWNKSHPAGARVKDQVKWAKEVLKRYEPEALRT